MCSPRLPPVLDGLGIHFVHLQQHWGRCVRCRLQDLVNHLPCRLLLLPIIRCLDAHPCLGWSSPRPATLLSSVWGSGASNVTASAGAPSWIPGMLMSPCTACQSHTSAGSFLGFPCLCGSFKHQALPHIHSWTRHKHSLTDTSHTGYSLLRVCWSLFWTQTSPKYTWACNTDYRARSTARTASGRPAWQIHRHLPVPPLPRRQVQQHLRQSCLYMFKSSIFRDDCKSE